MSSLQTLQDLVQINIGGRDDASAVTVMKAAINYASILAALVFEPPELKAISNLTVTGGSDNTSFSSLTQLLDILTVYNTTDSCVMWFVPYEQFEIIIPASVGKTKYYTVFGETIYVKDTPSVNKTLKLTYSNYPTTLVNPTDELEFEWHDPYIVGVASGICMAAFEEGESAQTWQGVVDAVGVPLMLGARARQVISGQKLTLEAAIAQLRGEK